MKTSPSKCFNSSILHHFTSFHVILRPGFVPLPPASLFLRDAGTQNVPSCRVIAAAAMPTVGDEVYRLGLDLSNEARRVDEMGILHRNFRVRPRWGDSLAELLTPGVDVYGRWNELGR